MESQAVVSTQSTGVFESLLMRGEQLVGSLCTGTVATVSSASSLCQPTLFSRAGRSRSATVVIAYLMWKTSLTYESAYQKVLAVRLIQPNSGFIQQLREYEAELVSQRNRQDV
eukprot:TRINITY_DN53_c0_g1_i4.p1 TRINITY_DN53_c0_g1~~TRINITY_DN53_c0_g1_i4.p1  ORF type:complete len:113 (-),score=14.74 TRINITY_DN53_c0_g1_i4:166-504(-)